MWESEAVIRWSRNHVFVGSYLSLYSQELITGHCLRTVHFQLLCAWLVYIRLILFDIVLIFDIVGTVYRLVIYIYAVQQDTQSFLMIEFYSLHMLARHVSDLTGSYSGALFTAVCADLVCGNTHITRHVQLLQSIILLSSPGSLSWLLPVRFMGQAFYRFYLFQCPCLFYILWCYHTNDITWI